MRQMTTSPAWSSTGGATDAGFTLAPVAPVEPALGPGIVAIVASVAEIESLRGVTSAAADVSECACPEPCERDHANE